MKTKTNNCTNESPLSIAKRLFSLTSKELQYWKRVDTLSLHEIILLFYGVIPERVLDCPLGKVIDDTHREFLSYLRVHFPRKEYIDPIPYFIRNLDEENLEDLLKRGFPQDPLDFEPRDRNLSTLSVIQWMESKNLAFPLSDHSLEIRGEDIPKEALLKYDLKRLDKDQLAKLIVRASAAAAWKEPLAPSLSKIQTSSPTKDAIKLAGQIGKKVNGYDSKTIEDWIRDLNPTYKPKK